MNAKKWVFAEDGVISIEEYEGHLTVQKERSDELRAEYFGKIYEVSFDRNLEKKSLKLHNFFCYIFVNREST